MEGPGEVSLFVYDNNSFVVESFLDKETKVNILLDKEKGQITNVATGEKSEGNLRRAPGFGNRRMGSDQMVFEVTLKPHSFKAFTF